MTRARQKQGLEMIYRIAAYGRDDERIQGSFTIPLDLLLWVREVAEICREDDGLGDYPLKDNQVRAVALRLGFQPELERFSYYLEPYEPLQDTSFHSDAAEI